MKANELMLGNIVRMANAYKTTATVDVIKQAEKFSPIPLTEEWLVKLGFKRWGKFDLWKTYQTTVCTIAGTTQSGFELSKIPRVEVEYVHQLQNLYFALTGEELKLTENENQQNQ